VATKLIFLALVLVFSILNIIIKLKKEKISTKRVLSLLLIPVIFPLGMFVYGYIIYPASFIPAFALWGFSWNLMFYAGVCIVFMIMFQLMVTGLKYRSTAKDFTPQIWAAISQEGLWKSSLKSGFGLALSTGIVEEILFRFIIITALFPLITVLGGVFSLSAIVSAIPPWLSLWASTSVSAPLFLAALVSNIIFCFLHVYEIGNHGVVNKEYWFRPFYTWFPSWVFFLFMINFGILGAIIIHFVYDLIGLVLGFYRIFDLINKDIASGNLVLAEKSQ